MLSVDQERRRIALGLKQLNEDPWATDIPGKYEPGQIVNGTVTKLTNFGVFVGLENGLEGLLHISELADHKVENPEEIVNVGDEIEVKILRVDADERKIGLSRKRVEWAKSDSKGNGAYPAGPAPAVRRGSRGAERRRGRRRTADSTLPRGGTNSSLQPGKRAAGTGAQNRRAIGTAPERTVARPQIRSVPFSCAERPKPLSPGAATGRTKQRIAPARSYMPAVRRPRHADPALDRRGRCFPNRPKLARTSVPPCRPAASLENSLAASSMCFGCVPHRSSTPQ